MMMLMMCRGSVLFCGVVVEGLPYGIRKTNLVLYLIRARSPGTGMAEQKWVRQKGQILGATFTASGRSTG